MQKAIASQRTEIREREREMDLSFSVVGGRWHGQETGQFQRWMVNAVVGNGKVKLSLDSTAADSDGMFHALHSSVIVLPSSSCLLPTSSQTYYLSFIKFFRSLVSPPPSCQSVITPSPTSSWNLRNASFRPANWICWVDCTCIVTVIPQHYVEHCLVLKMSHRYSSEALTFYSVTLVPINFSQRLVYARLQFKPCSVVS